MPCAGQCPARANAQCPARANALRGPMPYEHLMLLRNAIFLLYCIYTSYAVSQNNRKAIDQTKSLVLIEKPIDALGSPENFYHCGKYIYRQNLLDRPQTNAQAVDRALKTSWD